jgi:hypothetical protein
MGQQPEHIARWIRNSRNVGFVASNLQRSSGLVSGPVTLVSVANLFPPRSPMPTATLLLASLSPPMPLISQQKVSGNTPPITAATEPPLPPQAWSMPLPFI